MKPRNPSKPEKPRPHEEWQVLVSAYRDNEVTPEERAQVESHLAGCAECAGMLAAYGRLGKTIRAMPQGAPSRALWQRVQERISRPGLPLWRRLLPVVSAAALVLVTVTLLITITLRGSLSPSGGRGSLVPAAAPAASQAKNAPAEPTVGAMSIQAESTETDNVGSSPPQPMLGAGGPVTVTCPGQALAFEVTSLSVRVAADRTAPRVLGTTYDAEGKPLSGLTVVISGTAGWQGAATTDATGTFSLELPAAGQYRVVLVLEQGHEREYAALTPAAVYDANTQPARWSNLYLPEVGPCQAPLDVSLAPVYLDTHDEAVLVLKVK